MTLQRMARESSEETLLASREFRNFLNTLPLQDAWKNHTWKSNSFKAKKEHGHFLIQYEEYRTGNAFGTYTFNRKGKLEYYRTRREKIQQALSHWLLLLTDLLVLTLWLVLPAAAIIMISVHPRFSPPYSLIPYILCLTGMLFYVFVLKEEESVLWYGLRNLETAVAVEIFVIFLLLMQQFHFLSYLQSLLLK